MKQCPLHLTGHEVVEVDGFVFKRKRSQPEKDGAPAASEQSAAKKPRLPDTSPRPAATPQQHITTAATPAAHTNKSLHQVLPQHLTAATPGVRAHATPAARPAATPVGATPVTRALLQQLPTDAAEPDRLASLCELLCAAEIEELESAHAAEDTAAVDAVKAVLAAFATSVRAAAAEGSFQVSTAQNHLQAERAECPSKSYNCGGASVFQHNNGSLLLALFF